MGFGIQCLDHFGIDYLRQISTMEIESGRSLILILHTSWIHGSMLLQLE